MTRINFELNVTLRCNLACPNCNRHCHLKPTWAEDSDMNPHQIVQFVDALRDGPVKAKRVKIAGGEPLLHPYLGLILELLLAAVDEGLIQKIKIDSNGTLPILDMRHERLQWSGRKPPKKAHLPCLWSPADLDLPILFPCSQPKVCGISLDSRGYLPCSPAIAIAHTIGLEGDEYFDGYWEYHEGLDLLKELDASGVVGAWPDLAGFCRHCVHAAPKAWREEHCKPLNHITAGEKIPTKTWAEAMQCD